MHLDLSTITQFTVPAFLGVILSYLLQVVKPQLERIPGIRPNDASHDDNLRICYGVVAGLLVLGYELLVGSVPHDAQGWATLLGSSVATAVVLTNGAHLYYKRMIAGKVDSLAAPAIYPPVFDATSQLPSTPSAQIVPQPQETVAPGAA